MNIKKYLIGLLENAIEDLDFSAEPTARGRIRAVIRALESDNIEEDIWGIAADIEKLAPEGQAAQ